MVAAAHVHTIERHGPDRVVGFSPIPAMSMASYAGGTRFLSLIGGVCLSFYDWYADLPPASPQVWGDQTDVPESADWWNASYLMMWGSNIPMTRTPDAHFMTEARYRGQKIVVVSPDYSDHTKFADHWLAAAAGHRRRAGAGDDARDPAGVLRRARDPVLRRTTSRRFTDLPFLVRLASATAATSPTRFLRASDLGSGEENAEWKPIVFDAAPARRSCPTGRSASAGARRARGAGTCASGESTRRSRCSAPTTSWSRCGSRFDIGETEGGGRMRRGVPARRIGGTAVTTVFDLLCAQLGVDREGLPGEWPERLRRPRSPTRRPGRRRSPASTPRWSPGSRASSPATPSAPRAAR